MTIRQVLCPQRVRRVPAHFSWIDHRLVRDRHIDRCDAPAAMLYLFLVTVADGEGLSWYSDASMMQRLSMDAPRLHRARGNLMRAGLIAWVSPVYQVLALEMPSAIRAMNVMTSPAPVITPSTLGEDDIRARISGLRTILGKPR